MKCRSLAVAFFGLLAGCSSGGSGSTTTATGGAFALTAVGAPSGGEARVSLKAGEGAATMVTVVSELNYDTNTMSLKGCAASGAGASGKSLNVAEPNPGTVRAVLGGSMEPLAVGSEVMTCTFTVAGNAPAGNTNVRVHGESADASFNDHPFSIDGTVQIGG